MPDYFDNRMSVKLVGGPWNGLIVVLVFDPPPAGMTFRERYDGHRMEWGDQDGEHPYRLHLVNRFMAELRYEGKWSGQQDPCPFHECEFTEDKGVFTYRHPDGRVWRAEYPAICKLMKSADRESAL